MSTRDLTASVVLILAGLFTTAWTVLNLSRALSWVHPGGGVGAVSIGLALGLVSFLVPLLLNWSVTKAARRHSPLAERFRRAHLWVTVGYAVWAVVSTALLMRAHTAADDFYKVIKVIIVSDAPSLPVQAFFAASVVAFIVGHPFGATRRGVT